MKNIYLEKIGLMGHLVHKFLLFFSLFSIYFYMQFKNLTENESIKIIQNILPGAGNRLFDFLIIGIALIVVIIAIMFLYWLCDNKIVNTYSPLVIDFFKQIALDILHSSYIISIAILSLGIIQYILYAYGKVGISLSSFFTFVLLLVLVFMSAFFIYFFDKRMEKKLYGIK